jgi:hypothetical protein
MKLKSAFISSIFSGWEKINENIIGFAIQCDVIYGPLNTTWCSIQLELQL